MKLGQEEVEITSFKKAWLTGLANTNTEICTFCLSFSNSPSDGRVLFEAGFW